MRKDCNLVLSFFFIRGKLMLYYGNTNTTNFKGKVKKVKLMKNDEIKAIGLAEFLVLLACFAVFMIVAFALGYNSGVKKRSEIATQEVLAAKKQAVEQTLEAIEELVNNYDKNSKVFNTIGDWNNYDELWADVLDGHIRCLNRYGRLWLSYEKNFDNMWK